MHMIGRPIKEAAAVTVHHTDNLIALEEEFTINWEADETLVADDRDALSPSEHVELKLIGLLRDSTLLVSQVQRRLRPGPR